MKPDFSLLLVLLTALTGLIWLFDSLLLRRRRMDRAVQTELQRARDPVVVEYSKSLFPILLIVLLFRSFLFEPFKIPSGSMIPTLLVGDFIVVNKFAYGLRLPVVNRKVVSIGEPERGDVAVFRYPVDPKVNFIKRVVGLPGDTITYRDKQLFINGEAVAVARQGRYSSSDTKCDSPRADAVRAMGRAGGSLFRDGRQS
jgi:signal peptidase I